MTNTYHVSHVICNAWVYYTQTTAVTSRKKLFKHPIPYSSRFSHGANIHAFRAHADFVKIITAKF